MMPDEPQKSSILPAMAHAAAMFAGIGMAGLFGLALYLKADAAALSVVLAAFLSYCCQVLLVIVENARERGEHVPPFFEQLALGLWVWAAVMVLIALAIVALADAPTEGVTFKSAVAITYGDDFKAYRPVPMQAFNGGN